MAAINVRFSTFLFLLSYYLLFWHETAVGLIKGGKLVN